MNLKAPLSALLLSCALAACESSDDKDDKPSGSSSSSASSSTSSNSSSSSSSSSSSTSSSSSSSSSGSIGGLTFTCPTTGLYFCDDFEDGTLDKWDDLIAEKGLASTGVFDVLDDGVTHSMRFTAGTRGPILGDGELIVVKAEEFAAVPSTDYFFEYRIRPRDNSNTGTKNLYGMTRYQGPLEWYFGGLNMQASPSSTQVEAGFASTSDGGVSGSLSRSVQVKRPIELGLRDETDGVWYTVRVDVVGSSVTVYLDGEELGTYDDAADMYADKGSVGFFTYNRSFEVDYVKVGDPSVKPAQLTLDYTDSIWETAIGDPSLDVTVTAKNSDGTVDDQFAVVQIGEPVVSMNIIGNVVSLSPVAVGEADVIFASGADSSLVRTITVRVTEGFTMPSTTYGDISTKVLPAPAATDEFIDGTLRVTFDAAPTLGTAGSVRIFRASDDAEVDVIRPAGETDALGFDGQDRVRTLNVQLLSTDGNSLVIKPHTNALAYDTEYYVAISDGVVSGAQLNGTDFVGLGENSAWTFTTKAAPTGANVTVDDDAAADFRSLQGALNYVMETVAKDDPAVITLKNGTYSEPLFLREQNNITISGENTVDTVVAYSNAEALNGGSGKSEAAGGAPAGGRALFLVEGGDLLTLENFTIHNTRMRSEEGSDQAEAIYFNSTSGRLIAKNMFFISEQDTLQLKGYSWFYESMVAGNVDFIWGYPEAALFEESEIRSLGDSTSDTSGGYILQARVQNETAPGFVFLNSHLTHAAGPAGNDVPAGATYLARSGGPAEPPRYDNIVFINTAMDSHIAAVGWAKEGVNGQPSATPAVPDADSGWREYGSTDPLGEPLDLSARDGGYILSDGEAAAYSDRASVFSGFNAGAGWNPQP